MKKILVTTLSLLALISWSAAPALAVGIFGACSSDSECNEGSCAGSACYCGPDYRSPAPDASSSLCRTKKTRGQSCTPGSTSQCISTLTCNFSGVCVDATAEAATDAAARERAGASCPCSCEYSVGTSPHIEDVPGGGVTGVNTCSGPRSVAAAGTACQELCRTIAENAHGTLTNHTVRCSASVFENPPTCPGDPSSPAGGGAPARTDYSPESFGYVNPLGTTSVPQLIGNLIRSLLGVVGAVFLAMFVYGGVLWSTAGGDSKRVMAAKTTLINAVMGMVIIAFSYSIVSLILTFAGQAVSSGS